MRGMSATYVILSFLALAGFISACSKPKAKNAEAVNNGQASESQIAKPILVNQEGISFTVDAADYGQKAGGSVVAKYSKQLFQSGEGVLLLTQYSQDMAPTPVNNEELTYNFQGITKDRKYYVAASFAVTNAALPKGIDFTRDIGSYFRGKEVDESYLREDEKTLEGLAEESFQPSLKKLQSLISSLKIEDPPKTRKGK